MATATSDHVSSLRRDGIRAPRGHASLAALVLRVVCAGLLVWVGAIHLHLWMEGYRDILTVGPLFLADAVGGFVLAAVLLVWPRPLAGLLGAGFMISTLGGLIISLNFGLFGFRESSEASFVIETIILESVGAVALVAWAVAVWRGWGRIAPSATALREIGQEPRRPQAPLGVGGPSGTGRSESPTC